MLAARIKPPIQQPKPPIEALRRSIVRILFGDCVLGNSISEVIGVATATYAVWIHQRVQATSIQAILLEEKEQSPQLNNRIVSNCSDFNGSHAYSADAKPPGTGQTSL